MESRFVLINPAFLPAILSLFMASSIVVYCGPGLPGSGLFILFPTAESSMKEWQWQHPSHSIHEAHRLHTICQNDLPTSSVGKPVWARAVGAVNFWSVAFVPLDEVCRGHHEEAATMPPRGATPFAWPTYEMVIPPFSRLTAIDPKCHSCVEEP